MRATGEHTAVVPIPAPPPPPTVEDAEKERRRRRRPKQAAPPGAAHVDAAGPGSCRSMPPMHVGFRLDAEAEASAAGSSRSCPLLPTPCPVVAPVAGMGGGAAGRWFYKPHWAEQAVEEALKRGIAFMGKFRVNAYNRNEAYCTIDGIPVDVLITGAAQNRAVEGVLVAITVDPVVYWTRMKGPNIACNPVIGGDVVVREVSETNGNHSLKKGQTDASCRFENSSNGLPVLDRMHYYHKNSGFNQAVKCENGHATVPESYEKDLNEGKTEAARALQRICSMIYSHPSRRPTGKVLSIVKKSPRRNAVVGFLAPFSEFPDGDQQSVQLINILSCVLLFFSTRI